MTITYAGHSTYVIETPGGVRIATDFSGVYGSDPLPRVATMNKAHRTHFSDNPDPGIEYVLRGWNPEGGPARHAVVVDDVYIRNVTTDIRNWGSDALERDGNSIFIFEVADLCIGHLGHLHTSLSDSQYGADRPPRHRDGAGRRRHDAIDRVDDRDRHAALFVDDPADASPFDADGGVHRQDGRWFCSRVPDEPIPHGIAENAASPPDHRRARRRLGRTQVRCSVRLRLSRRFFLRRASMLRPSTSAEKPIAA